MDETPAVERQIHDLQVILGVTRAMAGTMDLDRLLALMLDAAREVLGAERATLFLYDPDTHELHSKIAHGTGEIRFPADRGIAGAAAQGRRTVNIPDAYADPRFNQDVDRRTGYHTRCLLTVPLFGLEDQFVGVLQVLNKNGGVFSSYDERLAEALAAQVGVALQRARLMEHYVQKKQMEQSLAIASAIQQSLLPKHAPQVAGYDIAGWSQPADETGGDCYDFATLPGGRLSVTVADASGHGIGPALVIAETRALLRAIASHVDRVGEVLTRANSLLCADLPDGRFVTAFFGVLDPAAHRLDYASAGHGPLFWYRADLRAVTATSATGLPLGLIEDAPIEPDPSFYFAPGDMGIFLSDGILDAENPAGQAFGKDRLVRHVLETAERPAADIVASLAATVRGFLDGGRQLDDLTGVVVKRTR